MDEETKSTLSKALMYVSTQDVEGVLVGEEEYDRSWLADEGIGAYFTLVRCLHRLQVLCKRPASNGQKYDIFQHVLDSPDGDTGVLNTITDARRYLLLVQAELVRRGYKLPLQRHNVSKDKPNDAKQIMMREKK